MKDVVNLTEIIYTRVIFFRLYGIISKFEAQIYVLSLYEI